MLPRILEPELMDTPEEARDYDSMDHAEVNRQFVADFLTVWNRRSPILDVGTGTALIPIEFCRRRPEGEVIAIDAASHMLAIAKANVRQAGFESRITCQLIDAKEMQFEDESFPAVISNSIIHHIPDPHTVLFELARVAEVDGTIFVRDLLRPDDEATLRKLVETYAGNANAHQQQMFADSLHAALRLDEVKELVASVGYDPGHVKQTSDRHWTWSKPGS